MQFLMLEVNCNRGTRMNGCIFFCMVQTFNPKDVLCLDDVVIVLNEKKMSIVPYTFFPGQILNCTNVIRSCICFDA